MARLQPSGRAFLVAMLGGYTFTLAESVLLVEAAHMTDRLSALRASGAPSARDETLLPKHLASLLGALKVEQS